MIALGWIVAFGIAVLVTGFAVLIEATDDAERRGVVALFSWLHDVAVVAVK